MFGYLSVQPKALTKEQLTRYRSRYCAVCHDLKAEYGNIGRITLSNDMTFLAVLLTSLYEPEESGCPERCAVHPIKKQCVCRNRYTAYAAAMNILLSYYKCLDTARDGGRVIGKAEEALLKKAFEKVRARYPGQCEGVRESLEAINRAEDEKRHDIDFMCRMSGQLLGSVFVPEKDAFGEILYSVGYALGEFIYFMDAYEDYGKDLKAGRYNPLTGIRQQPDYEEFCLDTMRLFAADAVQAADMLPLEKDRDIIDHVLYGGIWQRYHLLHRKNEPDDAVKGNKQNE